MSNDENAKPRSAVFIDYQNVYRSAREAFGWTGRAGQFGNFVPLNLGLLLAIRTSSTLAAVRVYTGVHTPQGNEVQHNQMMRRIRAWLAASVQRPDLLRVVPRSLAYRDGGRTVQEKGIDVKLAIDMVILSQRPDIDRIVLVSADTDLVPAVDYVTAIARKPVTCVGLAPAQEHFDSPRALTVNHPLADRLELDSSSFARAADKRNFYDASAVAGLQVDQGTWQRIQREVDPRQLPSANGE